MADDVVVARPLRLARPRLRVAAVALLALVGTVGAALPGAGPAAAQESIVIDDPRLDPSLAGVQVDGDGYRKALAAWRVADAHRADAEARLATATAETDSLTAEQDRLTAEIDDAGQRGEAARVELEARRRSLRTVAVETYVQGRERGTDDLLRGAGQASETARQDTFVDDIAERRAEQVRAARATIDDTDATIARDTASRATVQERLAVATSLRDELAQKVAAVRGAAANARRSLADWRLAADVAGTDLPLVALDAYVKAAARTAMENPDCGLRWTGLAGIGKVESGHGSFAGSRLTANGSTSQPIVGIPLDGTNNTAAIGDTDGGALDGDPDVDRAVGPMQFIPGSWRTMGRDGNGDGKADPSNIYDAALAAAGLLCRAGGSNLDADAGLRRAALGYNNSASYADLVVRTARGYAEREATIIPPPPPPPPAVAPPSTPADLAAGASAAAAPTADAAAAPAG